MKKMNNQFRWFSENERSRFGRIVAVFIIFFSISNALCMVGENENDIKNTIKIFVEKSHEGKITRIDCSYVAWGDLTSPILEKNLIDQRYDYKVTVKSASLPYLLGLEKVFDKFAYDKISSNKSFDCRMSFEFYEQEKEVLRLTFVKNDPVVLINGQAYKTSTKLMITLLPMLPHEAYEGFQLSMLDSWTYMSK